jgi:dihydrofolate reductase
MRKVIVHNRITLDGFFAGLNDEIDWFIQDAAAATAAHEIITSDTMLLGRVSYQHLEAFWRPAADDPNLPAELKPMTDEVNNMTKLLFSRTLHDVTWKNSQLLHGDPVKEVQRLKQESGSDLLMFGSGTLIQQLSNAGLIDEYVLILTPVVLGKGKPMFKDVRQHNFELVSAKTFETGNVLIHYKVTT